MPLNTAQRRVLENWVRSKAILKCPSCGQDKGRFESAQDDTPEGTEGEGIVLANGAFRTLRGFASDHRGPGAGQAQRATEDPAKTRQGVGGGTLGTGWRCPGEMTDGARDLTLS